MDETIISESPVGRRLTRIPKSEMRFLLHGGQRFDLADQLLIGRDAHCGIVVDDPLVSREHCIIRRIRTAWYIEDLGSTNGTQINAKPLKEGKALRLSPEDVIKLGGRIEISLA
ncbi:MAG: FHA domain-containing protein [Spirochaetales bacterium]|nr:FHA domain-containing protein [Spirochaetales bacterium]